MSRTSPSALSTGISASARSPPKNAAMRWRPVRRGGQIVDDLLLAAQREVNVRIRQCDSGECFGRMAHFGLRRAQKLPPHRGVEKQIVHFDGGSDAAAARRDWLRISAVDNNFRPRVWLPPAGCAAPACLLRRSKPAPRRGIPACRRETDRRHRQILLVACAATASGS